MQTKIVDRFTLTNQEGAKVSLGVKNVLLRGCILRNTGHVHGMVIYTGKDTKIQVQSYLVCWLAVTLYCAPDCPNVLLLAVCCVGSP